MTALVLSILLLASGVLVLNGTTEAEDSEVPPEEMGTRATSPHQKTEAYETHTGWNNGDHTTPVNQQWHNYSNYLVNYPQREFWLRCKNVTEDYQWLDDVNFTTNGDEVGLCKEDVNLTQTFSDPMNFSYPKAGQKLTAQYDPDMKDMGTLNFTINPMGLLPIDPTKWVNPNLGALKELHVEVRVDTDGDYDWEEQDGTIEGRMVFDFNWWDTPYDPMNPSSTVEPYTTVAREMQLTQRQMEEYMDGIGYWMDLNDDGYPDIPGDINQGAIWVLIYRVDNQPDDLDNRTLDLLVYCGYNEKLSWIALPYKHPKQLPEADTGEDRGFPENRREWQLPKKDPRHEDPIFNEDYPQLKEGELVVFDATGSYDPQDDVGVDGLGYGHPDWPGPDDGDGNGNIDDGFPEGEDDFNEEDTLKYKWDGEVGLRGQSYRVPMSSGWQSSPIFEHRFKLPTMDPQIPAEDQWLIVNVTLTVIDRDRLQDTHTVQCLVYKSQNPPLVTVNVVPQIPPTFKGETYALYQNDVEFNGFAYDPDPNTNLLYEWLFEGPYNYYEYTNAPRIVQTMDELGDWNVSLSVYDGPKDDINTMVTVVNYIVHVVENVDPIPVIWASELAVPQEQHKHYGSINSTTGRTIYFNGSESYDPDVMVSEGDETDYFGLPGWDEDEDLVPDYPLKYRWTWGDSSETSWSFSPSAEKVWYDRGAKSEQLRFWPVKLWVWDGREQIESPIYSVYINLPPTANAGPNRPTPEEGELEVGMEITFDGSGSYDPNDDPNYDGKRDSQYTDRLNYLWDFGDGSAQVSGRTATHVYSEPDLYTVRLTVSDPKGMTASATTLVRIVPANIPPTGVVDIKAEWIDINEKKLYTLTTITFDATQSYDQDGIFNNDDKISTSPLDDLYDLTWNFGDGSAPSHNWKVEHTYEDNGTFEVIINMTDRKGAIWEETYTIQVENRKPIAMVKINSIVQNIKNQPVILSAEGSYDDDGQVIGYYWDFGDGTHSDETKGIDGYEKGYTKAHEYTKTGVFEVKVRVMDDDGGKSEPEIITVKIFKDEPEPTPMGTEVIIGGILSTITLLGILSSTFVWMRKRA